jgi:hypothetical protein
MNSETESGTDAAGWWPTERQPDWQRLVVSTVDWLIIWNVNLGGGQNAFSVQNGHWGNHPFQPNAVGREQAWVWWAEGTRPPYAWRDVGGLGGIISLIGATCRGIPIHSGVVLVPGGDSVAHLVELTRTLDDAVARHGGAWCPALVGDRSGARFAISVQRTRSKAAALEAATTLGIDDIAIVDPFGDRGFRTAGDPEIFVRGRRDGRTRTARPGRTARAYVDVPLELTALREGP